MGKHKPRTLFLPMLLLILLSGCQLPGLGVTSPTPLPTVFPPEAVFTLAMRTHIALSQTPPPVTATVQPVITPTPPATSTPSPLPPAATEVLVTVPAPAVAFTILYQEDFTRPGGWVRDEQKDFAYGPVNGAYRIDVRTKGSSIWSIRSGSLADVRVEVDGYQRSGDPGSYYGVICRHDKLGKSYYAFLIAGDGSYAIGKRFAGEFVLLDQGKDGSGVIQGGNSVNRVAGDCLGQTLVLYANGQKLLEVQDSDLTSGATGLLAYSSPTGHIEAIFDNFAILTPED